MSGQAVVLGAAGFIGRHVCLKLATAGVKVIGMGHGAWSVEDAARWGVSSWVESDITLEALNDAIGDARPDHYLHCAGGSAVSQSYASPLNDFDRTVSTTAALLEHVRMRNPRARVVLASSAAVYGDQGDVDVSETSTRSPVSPYGFNKLGAENLCDCYARFFGVGVGIVRLFSVYGEGLRKQLLWDAVNKLSRGNAEFFGTGNELRDWIHIDDAAELLCAVALGSRAHFEVVNGGHVKATTRDVLGALARELGSGLTPQFTGEAHTGNPRRLTGECEHALRQFGWRPRVGLDQGLARYVRWFREVGPSLAAVPR